MPAQVGMGRLWAVSAGYRRLLQRLRGSGRYGGGDVSATRTYPVEIAWLFMSGVNITAGCRLPDPADHGTAFDIARREKAKPESMAVLIKPAMQLAYPCYESVTNTV